MGILRILVLKIIDTACECRYTCLVVFGTQSGQVDAAQQEASHLRSVELSYSGEDLLNLTLYLLVVNDNLTLRDNFLISIHNSCNLRLTCY